MHKCVPDVVLWFLFFQKFRKPKIADNMIYLEWHVLWIEAKQIFLKSLQNYAGVFNFSSKVPWQMGASLIFTLTKTLLQVLFILRKHFTFFFKT